MKLNLGCGPRHLAGFVNVDMGGNWSGKKPDVEADLSKPLPFEDESADEIHAYHLFEHFYRYEADEILMDWTRVLKVGGLLVIELPCLDKIISIINHCVAKGLPLPERLTVWGLYGDPNYENPAMCHRWCYSESELTTMMRLHGMEVESTTPQTHQPVRDMRLEGRKGML